LYELAWTVFGVGLALALIHLRNLSTKARDLSQTHAPALPPAAPEPVVTKSIRTAISLESRDVAMAMARELASLVSAVEGRAHHLIEAAPTRTQLPSAAEAILLSIARLRNLHTKLVAFAGARHAPSGTTDITELINSIGDDLQEMQLGLELRFDPPPDPPLVDACPDVMRDVMLFMCAALLKAERDATRLTFTVERSFASESPEIVVECNVEWIQGNEAGTTEKAPDTGFALELEAGRQLVHSIGGRLSISHLPGKSVQAVLQLPMSVPQELSDLKATEKDLTDNETEDPSSHKFGGALVLESDPALRAVLSRELKASGRAVFACADGASAHTFLQATPDRFELLIVDDLHQLDDHTPLARTIREHTPDLKICLMAPTATSSSDSWPDLHCLQKPFGVHELRRKLASILAVG